MQCLCGLRGIPLDNHKSGIMGPATGQCDTSQFAIAAIAIGLKVALKARQKTVWMFTCSGGLIIVEDNGRAIFSSTV